MLYFVSCTFSIGIDDYITATEFVFGGCFAFGGYMNYNIIYENINEIIKEGHDVLVPFLASLDDSGISYEGYEEYRELTERCAKAFAKSPFSKRSIDLVDSLFESEMNKLGFYRESKGLYRYYKIFGRAPDKDYTACTGAQKLEKCHLELVNLTNFELVELLNLNLPSYIIIKDDKIVAIATVNESFDDKSPYELTVECHHSYRRKGYAKDCLTSLMCALTDKPFVYVTSCYNRASIALAGSVGLCEQGKFYAYTVFKDN